MMAAGGFLGLAIGDAVAVGGARSSLVLPGPARWYALRVTPQREDQAEAWLRLRGVYAFHPVVTRRVVRAGKARSYARRYLPGYVFARFGGQVRTHLVLACPFITGALCRADGAWGVLEPSKLQAIHSMRKLDAEAEAARAELTAQRQAALRARAGGRALFTGGTFAGQSCEVVELVGDDGVRVRMGLFGGDVLVTAQASDLIALETGDLTRPNHCA